MFAAAAALVVEDDNGWTVVQVVAASTDPFAQGAARQGDVLTGGDLFEPIQG